ncbi:MAG: glycerol-3-phosphate dehydrogenase/oxidase [Actinomycetota bacterium]|nr:glycerol-3-phosphate dehydrogenase/oxidase [Actinomycetota bacterium]
MGSQHRREAIRRLSEERVDVLIVGAGVTGIGCALDAASRGMSVAVVEQHDLASGTSSRSSKLIHGGLRYLEQFQFGLVKEALTERNLLLSRLAPHLVRRVDFLYPIHRLRERLYAGFGIGLYDLLASRGPRLLPRHRHLGQQQVTKNAPALKGCSHKGAIVYSDALVDDARFVISAARTAAKLGASIATSTRVVGLSRSKGRVSGATVRCLESGREFHVSCGTVVNATGVWSDDIEAYAGESNSRVRASKGIHLVVPRHRINLETGLILRTVDSVLFVIPSANHWIVGTTDSDWHLNRAHPAATHRDIAYLITTLNEVLADPLTTDDVVGVYVGLRPLLAGDSEKTSKLSREHAVTCSTSGLVSIAGGKYTTYRVMAADTIDAVGVDQGLDLPKSSTDQVPLIGSERYLQLRAQISEIAEMSGVLPATVEHLLSRQGDRIYEVLDLIEEDVSLAELIDPHLPYVLAEVVHAVRFEAALHLEDVLTRRTRLSIESPDRGTNSALRVAELMARELNWDRNKLESEVGHYLDRVAAERASNEQLDDVTADAQRLAVGEIRDNLK